MSSSRCRGCGAHIVWVTTTAGRSMPCDAVMVSYRPAQDGKDKIVTINGAVVSGNIVSSADATDIGYRPHWATCPQSSRFKKGTHEYAYHPR